MIKDCARGIAAYTVEANWIDGKHREVLFLVASVCRTCDHSRALL